MMSGHQSKKYVADFETTTHDPQKTHVWLWGLCPLNGSYVTHGDDIDSFFRFLEKGFMSDVTIFFHNLKFDGEFILSYLLKSEKYNPAMRDDTHFIDKPADMDKNTYTYMIGALGQWYSITLKTESAVITFRDSLKLLPFSIAKIAKDFKLKYQKLDLEYEAVRGDDYTASAEDIKYLKHDLYILRDGLKEFFKMCGPGVTIGSCCLKQFKKPYLPEEYAELYPNLFKVKMPDDFATDFQPREVGWYIHRAYHGGWCHLKEGCENVVYRNGVVLDVSSLYPYCMHSESGAIYPVGRPRFFRGAPPLEKMAAEFGEGGYYYFVRIRTRFYLKNGFLPFVQIKRNILYTPTEHLKTSDVRDSNGIYHQFYTDAYGEHPATVDLVLTMHDFDLLKNHYHLVDLQFLDGMYFEAQVGMFDFYIDKYREIKMHSEGAVRTLAKLMSNNLYGKFAATPQSDFKIAHIKEDGQLGYVDVAADEKTPGYIPIGAAITSYARKYIINIAQANFKNFIYGDTDSAHLSCGVDEVKGVKIHPTEYGAMKVEKEFDVGLFVRQKTYLETCGDEIEIKCAGMPAHCKDLLTYSMGGNVDLDLNALTAEEFDFATKPRKITDFKLGLCVPGKLIPRHVDGGILLTKTTYMMR